MIAYSFIEPARVNLASRNGSRFLAGSIAATFLWALAAASAAAAQEPQPAVNSAKDSGFVLRQTVRRVRVDVTVTDAQGNPVPGLMAADFRLSEDGRAQSIRQFEWQGAEAKSAQVPIRPVLPPHMYMNLSETPERGPLTVLLCDVLNTPLDAQPYAHQQMVEFLKKSTGQQIAIFVLSDRLRLLQGFTSDSRMIQRAANDSRTMPQRQHLQAIAPTATEALADVAADEKSQAAQHGGSAAGTSGIAPTAGSPGPYDTMLQEMSWMEASEASALLDRRVDLTLEAFEQIGRFLSGIAGRKNLIWYSGSFPAGILPNLDNGLFHDDTGRNNTDHMKAATNLLNDAETAVYPVDARGLQTNQVFSASQSSPPGGSHATPTSAMREVSHFDEQISAEHAAMDLIGEQTGGRAFYNTNGLELALEKASSDGLSYYSLIYAPSNTKFDGSVRRISVSLEHNHYHLAYRRSYLADDVKSRTNGQETVQENNISNESMTAASQFDSPPAHQLVFAAQVDAIGTPAPSTKGQMTALRSYLEKAAKTAGRTFVEPTAPIPLQKYVIQYAVLARQLDLSISENNVYHPRVSLAALAFNAEGETLWGIRSRIEDDVPAPEIDKFLENSCRAVQTLLIPADTAILRLVVRDDRSGRVGSMEIRLPLPPEKASAARAH